jgi:hypothetical protein
MRAPQWAVKNYWPYLRPVEMTSEPDYVTVMKSPSQLVLTRAQESRAAIERLYITMRHLFNRGYYKPSKVSGREMRRALLTLRPKFTARSTTRRR